MGAMASQITSPMIVYSTVYSGADQRKYRSSASLAFVQGIHRLPVHSSHKWPVTRKMFPFDDVIMPWLYMDVMTHHTSILLAGSFLIPYFLCMFFCGIPLFFMELAISQYSGFGPVSVWKLCPIFQGKTWIFLENFSDLKYHIQRWLMSIAKSSIPMARPTYRLIV